MKLKKNDYQELRKGGLKAVDAKLIELKGEQAKIALSKMKNEIKNLREGKMTRLAITKIKTIRAELKETK